MTDAQGRPATEGGIQLEELKRRAAEYTRPADVESTVETHVIKENDLFMLSDTHGDVPEGNQQGLGLYLRDTRYLSTYEMLLDGKQPTLLDASSERNCLLSVDMTNPDLEHEGEAVRNQSISIRRSRLVNGAVYELISFVNYGTRTLHLNVSLAFDSDFQDIFEVRGYQLRDRRGKRLPSITTDRSVALRYEGLDGVERRTTLRFPVPPQHLDENRAIFHVNLPPREETQIRVAIVPQEGADVTAVTGMESYETARHELELSYSNWLQTHTQMTSSSELFDDMVRRSVLDLRLLLMETEHGPVVTAGVPWFACVFGRDSLIAALQSLIFSSDLARATLRLLARHQGQEVNPWKEEQPGKILHELRRGEMAALGEVPHTPYYGSADATPLWLCLLAETFRWTGDRALVDELWEPALRALEWIDRYGDADGDGYVEYQCNSPRNLINHGWKDSAVAVFHEDGTLAEQPIALIEIQSYVYAAKRGMADLCEVRGDAEHAARLRAEAEELRERLNRDYWMPGRGFMAFALDGHKRQVRTITSNPGHALWAGVVKPELARQMVSHFMRSDLLSGWGVRCVGESEAGYNPLGYHLGTVWPHDVTFLVAGLRRYGYTRDAGIVATQLYQAGLFFRYHRLPEVFTGIARMRNPFPVPYPVACSPQAWSAGTTLSLVQTFLGIAPDAGNNRVGLAPTLPPWLSEARVSALRIGDSTLDVRFLLHGDDSTVQVLSRTGKLEVMI